MFFIQKSQLFDHLKVKLFMKLNSGDMDGCTNNVSYYFRLDNCSNDVGKSGHSESCNVAKRIDRAVRWVLIFSGFMSRCVRRFGSQDEAEFRLL